MEAAQQLQMVVAEVQAARQQVASLNAQLRELEGTVEAVKTVSDLFMPLSGKVIETNSELEDRPELVNEDPYGEGWIIKIDISDISESSSLLSYEDYKNLVDS